MGRGDINISANFRVAVAKALDAKSVRGTLAEMHATVFAYPGLVCYCLEDATLYVLEALPATTPGNWRKVGSGTVEAVPAHGHAIADIEDLPETLDRKLGTAGGTVTGDLAVQGDLTVSGTLTRVNTSELAIADNVLEVNSNQTGTPPATLEGGLRVNRGKLLPYLFVFRQADSTFRIGEQGDLQAVATRQDHPAAGSLAVWDEMSNRYGGVTGDSGQLLRWGAAGPEFFEPDFLTSLPAHGHTISQVANLQAALDGKAARGHGHQLQHIATGNQAGVEYLVTARAQADGGTLQLAGDIYQVPGRPHYLSMGRNKLDFMARDHDNDTRPAWMQVAVTGGKDRNVNFPHLTLFLPMGRGRIDIGRYLDRVQFLWPEAPATEARDIEARRSLAWLYSYLQHVVGLFDDSSINSFTGGTHGIIT